MEKILKKLKKLLRLIFGRTTLGTLFLLIQILVLFAGFDWFREYLIYMLGFIAGFPYLGGMDKRIATPRLKSPRVKIEGGSVGIAGEQTGIYPVASPGGWQLIGRTPLKLYDSEREKPVLLESGQYIKFRPVTEEEYKAIEKQVENDTYQYVVYDKEAE